MNFIKTKLLLLILLLIIFIGLATALVTNINLNRSEEDKLILSRVGDGIGEISKVREICDNETGEDCFNETYIDNLKLVPLDCYNGFCHFKLYEENGINKEFKVELERKCAKEGICIEEGFEYGCCLEWRAETDEEVLAKAEKEMEKILNKIISVTKQREAKQSTERFEEIEINI